MKEIIFGNLDGRELTLRITVPPQMERWDGSALVLSWRKLLIPRNWWRSALCRGNWSLWWRRFPGMTHRCWCPTGSMFDASLRAAGWGVVIFYSRYDGDVPCECDKVIGSGKR